MPSVAILPTSLLLLLLAVLSQTQLHSSLWASPLFPARRDVPPVGGGLAARGHDADFVPPNMTLLLASHGNLVAYNPLTGRHRVLHQDAGIFYSTFPAYSVPPPAASGSHVLPDTLWTVVRSTDPSRPDTLQQIHLSTPAASNQHHRIRTVALDSQFTHEATTTPDLPHLVLLADTHHGQVHLVNLSAADPAAKTSKLSLFTKAQHVNSISPVPHTTHAWVVLHNRGHALSDVVLVDVGARQDGAAQGRVLCHFRGIGRQSHHFLKYRDGYLSLSSADVALVHLKPTGFCRFERSELWRGPAGLFLKGLAVVQDVAWFASSPYQATAELRRAVACQLWAFNLTSSRVAWSGHNLGTRGLVNSISLAYFSPTSTYLALPRLPDAHLPTSLPPSAGAVLDVHATAKASCSDSQRVLEQLVWAQNSGAAFGLPLKRGFTRLGVRIDAARLQQEIAALTDQIGGWTWRADVNNYFITLATQNGLAQDESTAGPFLPVPGLLSASPYLSAVLASLGVVVGRCRLMMLKPGQLVRAHVDRTHHVQVADNGTVLRDAGLGYWGRRFRVHIPIITNDQVMFTSGQVTAHLPAGAAYVFDNSVLHSVENLSDQTRVHLVVDTLGSLAMFDLMRNSKLQAPVLEDHAPWFERWVDVPVFDFMAPQHVASYLEHVLQSLPPGEGQHAVEVRERFAAFVRAWSANPAPNLGWDLLLDPLLCAGLGHTRLLQNGRPSLTLFQALEPFVRSALYFTCKGHVPPFPLSNRGPPCFQA